MEEPSQSASLTQPTINQRASRQRKAVEEVEEEDSPFQTDSGVAPPEMDEDADPTEGVQADPEADPEDDESTAGYEQESDGAAPRSRGLLLAAVAVVALLVLGLGIWWALSGDASETTQPDGPLRPQGTVPTGAQPAKPSPPAPGTPAPAAPTAPAPAQGSGSEAVAAAGNTNATPEAGKTEPAAAGTEAQPANPPGEAAGPENTVAAANPGDGKPPSDAAQPGTPDANAATPADAKPADTKPADAKPADTKPADTAKQGGVGVIFKTNTAVIRVDGQKVEPNKVLSYAPGKITVEWSCPPKRRREGSDIKRLKGGRKDPYVYEIKCRKSSR